MNFIVAFYKIMNFFEKHPVKTPFFIHKVKGYFFRHFKFQLNDFKNKSFRYKESTQDNGDAVYQLTETF